MGTIDSWQVVRILIADTKKAIRYWCGQRRLAVTANEANRFAEAMDRTGLDYLWVKETIDFINRHPWLDKTCVHINGIWTVEHMAIRKRRDDWEHRVLEMLACTLKDMPTEEALALWKAWIEKYGFSWTKTGFYFEATINEMTQPYGVPFCMGAKLTVIR